MRSATLTPILRSAARDLAMMPEMLEASRLHAAADHLGALRQVERAAEVVVAVPMPAMQVVACGAPGLQWTRDTRCSSRA